MITSPDQIPKYKHFAALVFKTNSIYHEGDERSRTCPGHGYPAHTETIHSIDYISFGSKEQMDAWVVKAETASYDKPKYSLIEAQPLKAKITATVLYN
jgi:hypothetical protein